jgi:tRNA threonylcarbamoyladenosine biosynthesis protein TsaB
MIILTLRTDKPEAELGLYEDAKQLSHITWQAHRQLSSTIHQKITELLEQNQKQLTDIQGIVCFKGPGSFTGLRIGLTTANALAYSLTLPIVSEMGEDWVQKGQVRLQKGESESVAMPEYGAEAFTTQQKK